MSHDKKNSASSDDAKAKGRSKQEGQPLQPPIGKPVHLADYDPDYHGDIDRHDAKDELKTMQKRLTELQEMLYAQDRHALLIVLQAMDAGGKDGTIKKVFSGVNPQGFRIANFKAPSEEALQHDFLLAHPPADTIARADRYLQSQPL